MRAGIALGSNLGDRLASLLRARAELLRAPGVGEPVSSSRVYETEAVDGEEGDAAFLNAVIEIEFEGRPLALLEALQQIEVGLGRPLKHPRNAPRIIDLDLLYAGAVVSSGKEFVVPHPRLHLRRFVLAPLAEIRPALIVPGQQQTIAELLAGLNDPATVEIFAEQWT